MVGLCWMCCDQGMRNANWMRLWEGLKLCTGARSETGYETTSDD